MKRVLLILTAVAASLMFAAPAMAAPNDDKPGHCSAYRYVSDTNGNICGDFPGDDDRDCGADNIEPVKLLFGSDPWRLDRDDDGTGCEASETGAGSGNSSNVERNGAATLPKTGPGMVVGIGGVVLAAGIAAFAVARRRRVRFEA